MALIWSTAWLDEALRQALAEYGAAIPRRLNDTLALAEVVSANGREFEFLTAGVMDVLAVQIPHREADLPAPPRAFEWWRDARVIALTDYTASPTDTARIFYTVPHTVKDLDSATITTVRAEHETILVLGAAALAVLGRSVDLAEQVTVSNQTVQELRLWGDSRLRDFRAALAAASRLAASGQPWVALPSLDRWDR